jgi:long-chain fatty acid transport protein
MNKTFFLFFFIVFLFVPDASIFAGGFVIYNHDAAATGVAGAFTAQADNPSAVLYNPAAINRLSGTNISFGNTIVIPRGSFRSQRTGVKTHMKDHTYLLPNFYVTHEISDKIAVGLGVFSYFGLATDWPDDWEGKFISTFAELRTFFINPVVSYQLTPRLSIAVGIAPFYSDVRLKRALGVYPLPFSLGNADLDADGFDVTYNFALLFQVSEKVKFGFSYRSGVDIEYDGNIRFKTLPLFSRILPDGGVKVNMDLPPIITTGLAVDISESFTIECDLYWQGWSSYDELVPKYDKPVPFFLKGALGPIDRDYHDILDFCVGFKYKVRPDLVLRCGYFHDRTPVPQKSLDPTLPDADKHTFSMGFGYKNKKSTFDFTYYAVFYENRDTKNNLDGLNGKYESFSNLICASFTYAF